LPQVQHDDGIGTAQAQQQDCYQRLRTLAA
jgi:hypothetical protein